MDISLEGVLFHGKMRRMDVYMVPHTYAGGSNVTIHCLNESLKRMQNAYREAKMKWPHTLFVQLDNTTKENKNQFVLAWAQTLVDTFVFDDVYISFLPVGHTHEDIDQRFSVISRKLRREAILSIQHFKAFLEGFFKTSDSVPCHAEFVPWVYNFRDWAEERTNPKWTQAVHKYHHYRFHRVDEAVFSVRDEEVPNHRARCHMKAWVLDDLEWYPPPLMDKKVAGGRVIKVPCHGLRVLCAKDFGDFADVNVLPFEGACTCSVP
jgi:hypothetical protein